MSTEPDPHNVLLDAALRYVERGRPVVPLHTPGPDGCSCTKGPRCESTGKHPRTRHGKDDATTDPATIRNWWRMWPDANVGIATGEGISVLDVDPRNDGDASLAELEDAHGEILTLTVRTGGGGLHFYFEGDLPARNGFRPGLDLKAAGGLVVAPPSLHESGTRYEFVDPEEGLRVPPEWLATLLRKETPPPGPAPEVEGVIGAGGRNATLASLAGTMRRRGMETPEILAALLEVNTRRCHPPLMEDEVEGIAASVTRYRPANDIPEEWPERPRLPGTPEPERLPLDVLPPTLAAHVRSVSEALQVPPELPGLLALACVSAAAAGRVEVEARPGWREPVGIYTATILPPAGRKSPTYAAMVGPLREWEEEAVRLAKPGHLAAEDVVDVARAVLDGTKKAAARGKGTRDEVEAARLRLSEAEAAMPPNGRLLAGDLTPEALVQRLVAQGGRVALLEPEPGPLQMVAGRYSDSARLGEFNKCWSAEGFTVDRVGRPPLHVRRSALTLAVLLQPDVLENLPNGKALRAEGLVGRILWCRPPHGLGTRRTGADVPSLDIAAADTYACTLRRLLEMEPAGAEPDGTPMPHVLRLEPEALAVLHSFEAEVEVDLADGGRYASIRDWAGKMVGQSLRLAALLELGARAGDARPLVADVGPWAMAGAVRLVRGLASHAFAVLYGLEPDPRAEALRYLVRRLQEIPGGTTETELRDSARRHRYIEGAEDVADLLDELERRGCVRRVRQPRKPGAGRDPSPELLLHPLLVRRTPGERPEYPDNSPPDQENCDSRDNGDTFLGAYNGTAPDPWEGPTPMPEDLEPVTETTTDQTSEKLIAQDAEGFPPLISASVFGEA